MRNAEGESKLAHEFGIRSRTKEHRRYRFLSIDPGDVHVGLAEFERTEDGKWYCVWAGEKTPEAFLYWYAEGLVKRRWEWVVCESWKLFPSAAPIYVGSDMPTSRLIGSITALAAFATGPLSWLTDPVRVFFQDPQIKVPTRGWLKRRKMRSIAKVLRVALDHATDAELHGYKYLIDNDLPVENTTEQEKRLAEFRPELSHSHALW